MKRFIGLLMIICVSLVFFGCASSEAEILSFDLRGATLIGDPVIDATARTVEVSVQPVDLSSVTPSVTVSAGATYKAVELSDGKEVNYTVIAENGSEIEWKITVTIAPGIFFTYGSTNVVLTKGIVDSENSANNEAYGNGVPSGYYETDDNQTFCVACKNVWELSDGDPTSDSCYFLINSKESGDVASDLESFLFQTADSSSPQIAVGMQNDNDVTFNISEYGDVGEYIRGTFSCSDAIYIEDETVGDDVEITNGRFKILRLADDME